MTATMEEANAALRNAVTTRLAATVAKPLPETFSAEVRTCDRDASCCRGPSATEVIERFNPTHPSSRAFFDLCDRVKEMHASKSRDYGSAADPLANIRNGAEFVGIKAWQGAMVRLSDKVTRLATFNRTGTLTHEGVEDTLMDLASYALLALVLYREEQDA